MTAPLEFALTPEVGSVRVFEHVLTSVELPCFTYVTDGLAALGQRGIAITFQRRANEPLSSASTAPLDLLRTISALAARKHLVDAGGLTGFGPAGAFGHPAIRGLAYHAAWPIDGVTLPGGCLAAVALVGEELEVARRIGGLRVLARLGRATRFFPAPPWVNPGRAPVATLDEATLLLRIPMLSLVGAAVVKEGDLVTLRLRPAAASAIAAAKLADRAPFGVMASIDPTADGCFVWSPGQKSPEAIAPPGSQGKRISGCFVLFTPEQAGDEVRMFEDGFGCLLRDATFARVRSALMSAEKVSVRSPAGEEILAVEWASE